MYKRIYLTILLIFFACESDSIKSTLNNGIEFEQHVFRIDNFLMSSQDGLGSISRGQSDLLFSGYIIDTLIDGTITKDTSRALITLDLSKFSDYDICSSVVRIDPPQVSLYSSVELHELLSSGQANLNIALLSLDDYDENDSLWLESGLHSLDISNIVDDDIHYSTSDSSKNELIIDLPASFISQDSTYLICENNNINLIIEYLPDDLSDDILCIDWYSSDFDAGNSLTPKVNLDYTKMESIDTTEYQFNIVNYLETYSSYYYIDSVLNDNWSTTFFMNINNLQSGPIDSLIDFSSLTVSSPIINADNVSSKIDLAKLRIELNDNPLAQDSISQIYLALDNVLAYVDEQDPSGDDYDGIDSMLTEGNSQYDILYNSIGSVLSNEKFNDFGSDNCENQYEKGAGECCVDNEECVYNNQGSENNSLLNWIDNDGDGLWTDGDSGEEWRDIGADGCSDEYETGDATNPCSDSADSNLLGTDPNNDNYNIDPSQDNYDFDTNLGSENNNELDWSDDNNNGQWDEGEGELWFDYGLDGLSNTGDLSENDMIFQPFEPFFDYGLDNIEDEYEINFCNSLIICTENNIQYDVGELDAENDLGIDGCLDEYETGDSNNPCFQSLNDDYVTGTDPNEDNYNIDPNNDNYGSDTDSGFESNGALDWVDGNSNGIWDLGEGEEWFDYGLDQTESIFEHYLPENQIIVSLGSNEYQIDIDNFIEYSNLEIPSFGDNQVTLWISSITQSVIEEDDLGSSNAYDLVFSIYSDRHLNGISFKLNHPDDSSNLKVTWLENYNRNYSGQYSYIDDGENQNKLFKDLSIYPLRNLDFYSNILPDSLILLNYGYDINCRLDSEKFNDFINNYSSGSISLQYSKIIIPVEMSTGDVKVNIEVPEDYISSSNYIIESPYSYVQYQDSNLEIDIGNLMQYYVSDDNISFNGFTLKNASNSYNFNSLYLNKSNSYIHLVVQK